MKKKSTKKKFKSVKEMDNFLESKDLSSFFESDGKVVRPPIKKINLDLPLPVLKKIDQIANEIGISRQPLIKMWLYERIKEELGALAG